MNRSEGCMLNACPPRKTRKTSMHWSCMTAVDSEARTAGGGMYNDTQHKQHAAQLAQCHTPLPHVEGFGQISQCVLCVMRGHNNAVGVLFWHCV